MFSNFKKTLAALLAIAIFMPVSVPFVSAATAS